MEHIWSRPVICCAVVEALDKSGVNAHGNVVYLRVEKSYYDSKLSNTFFEKISEGRATTRNWKTTLKLAEMAQNLSEELS